MTDIYLANTSKPTAYLDPSRAEPGDLEHYEVHLDGKPAPSHLMYAIDQHGDRILTAGPDELSIWAVGRGPVAIDSVELVS